MILGSKGTSPKDIISQMSVSLIQKADGSYWVCGENIGEEEMVVHGAEADYSIIYTYQFLPCH